MADILMQAVNDCILHFAKPQITQDIIYAGYQNVPAGKNDFVVVQLSDTKRIGTNVTDKKLLADTTIINRALREYVVDVDFCHTVDLTARERAVRMEIFCWSHYMGDFFKTYEIDFLHADEIIVSRYKSTNDQYYYRYSLPMHVSMWHSAQVEQDYFDKVVVSLENVDVHHKP